MRPEEYSRLLQDYMFGKLSASGRQQLAEAALESKDRGLEFAQADEIRVVLSNPINRRELLDQLSASEGAGRLSWLQTFWRTRQFVALAAGAAAIVLVLVVRDYRSRQEMPPVEVTSVQTPGQQPAATSRKAPVLHAEPSAVPAAIRDSSEEAMAALFRLPLTEGASFNLTLPNGTEYRAGGEVSCTVNLPAPGYMYAFVVGPDGAMREVYPANSAENVELRAGPHSFSFAATGRVDPESDGHFGLRVFVSEEGALPATGADGWKLLKDNSRFEETHYDVRVR